MLPRVALAVCLLGSVALPAQQAAAPVAEPQYSREYNALQDGRLVVLERQTAVTDTKSRRTFVITPSTKVFESIANRASPVRVGPGAHFVVRLATGDRDPQTLVQLKKLVVGKADRQIPIVTYKVSLIPGAGVNHKRAPDESIPVTINKYGTSSLEIIPQQPLDPGEYAFMSGHEAQCFGVDAGLDVSTPPPAPSAAPEHVQIAKPKGWIIDKLPEISDSGKDVQQTGAILEGAVTYKGRTMRAYLVMHCDFPTTDYDGLLPLEVILDAQLGAQELLNTPDGSPVDVSDFGRSQLGNAAPIDVNAKGQNRTSGARYRFFYDPADMGEIVAGAGQTLQLSLVSGPKDLADPDLKFDLPADAEPVRQVMNSCLAKTAAEAQALKAKTVASCPVKAAETLDTVALKYADTGKEVKGDFDEMDNGADWKLPLPAKGHTARKIVMICQYKKSDDSASQGAASDSETVPVPPTARSCDFTPHLNESRSTATCLSIPAASANATGTSPATSAEIKPAAPARQPSATGTASATSSGSLPAGPVAPVNRLNVRGISVRMGRNQIIAAALAANMRVIENVPSQLKLVDPTASGRPNGDDSGSGGSGLILLINLANDAATSVRISEQGDIHGHVFEDICKKWGKPSHLPTGYDSELGIGDPAIWGDKKGVYASYNPSIYSFGGQNVTIFDGVALAPHTAARKSVPM